MSALPAATPRRGDLVRITFWDGSVMATRVQRVTLIPKWAAVQASRRGERVKMTPARWYALQHLPGLVTVGSLGIRRIDRLTPATATITEGA